ncbi:MAG TPA: amidohydrolase family protein [Bryobacteraceae bacterium]|nr:amidohydrolase family protein [Bryobacteraceae bacterium]HOL71056.1 amidohydrolase family protein [Bryobacteraceae bacterium]HOQ43919.1 amidohydrolase family protein [Bryobacteraceae bacterium]HPU72897.1 amidohydrolase family protein [Bryobacteraceae bacterium]
MTRTLLLIVLCSFSLRAANSDSFLLRGGTVHPVSGPDIPNGAVLVRDGRIVEVGAKIAAPKGVRIIDVKGLHVYPGLIDSASQIGLSEIGSVRETNDAAEIGDFNPQVRAIIAINPASEHIPVTRANGITSAIAAPTGTLVAGQAALIHLDGWTWQEMAIAPSAAMVLQFPVIQARSGSRARTGAVPFAEQKRNYERRIQELRRFFEDARRYQKAKAAAPAGFETDLKYEAMLPVLEGKLPLVVQAARERAIKDAIAFAEREKLRIIISGATDAWRVAADLKARNIPLILGPTLALPAEEDDPYDKPFTAPGELYRAGVKFAFGSFSTQFARNLPYQAAAAVAFGLPYEEGLKALTLNAAEIWGVADQIGSIDMGKWADLIVTDGDPLEVRTQVKMAFIKGRAVDLSNKHLRLYQKYLERP